MKILLGGDYAPTKFNMDLFIKGDGESLYTKEMLEYLSEFDLRIFDFECCFSGGKGEKDIRKKYGPVITTPPESIRGIEIIHPSCMILANNHISNLNEEGIKNTINLFRSGNIFTFGAGKDLDEASSPYYVEKNKIKVGFYACAEHEFNTATNLDAGANPYDSLYSYDKVRHIKEKCNYVVVIYHGGLIDYRYPLPREREILRKFIDVGADLVVGQHTHCIGCEENYNGGKIIYGQGDFLFARPTRNEYRESGLLLEINADESGLNITYNVRIKPDNTIRLATEKEKNKILSEYFERSHAILSEGVLEDEFLKIIRKKKSNYLGGFMGKFGNGIFYRGLNKLTNGNFGKMTSAVRYNEKSYLKLINFLECETHHEMLLEILKNQID